MRKFIATALLLAATAAYAEGCGPVFYVVDSASGRTLACQNCYGVLTCN